MTDIDLTPYAGEPMINGVPLQATDLPLSQAVLDIIADDGADQDTARRHVEHGEYDTTSLKPETYKYAVHRDWIGHWTRWAWAGRYIKNGLRVLEPGCGRESMLFHHLHTNSNLVPELYLGVDLDKIKYEQVRIDKNKSTYKWAEFKQEFNFVTRVDELVDEYGANSFDRVVSFEVYEHITPSIGVQYLDACRKMLKPDGLLLLSTPVFNGKKAANHIREYTVDELRTILEDRGFTILDRFGTFASYHDIKRGIQDQYPDEAETILKVYERCREFLSDDLLAGMLSPLAPDYSRNNTWLCKPS